MSWNDFAAAVESALRAEGFEVTRIDRGETDFEARKASRTTLVGCKRFKVARTGIKPLQDLHAAMSAREADDAIYVAAGEFTDQARAVREPEPDPLGAGRRSRGLVPGFASQPPAARLTQAERPPFDGHAPVARFRARGSAVLLVVAMLAPIGTLLAAVCAVALIGAVIAAVHHAEVVAHRIGEPFGTLVLALAITVIEVALIVSIMLAGGADKAALPRDTIFAAVMIICNGVVGLCLLVGGLRHHEQSFRIEGANTGLAALIAMATLSLVLPTFTTSSPGGTYTDSQLAFAAIASLALWGVFVFVQTVRHRDYFLPAVDARTRTCTRSRRRTRHAPGRASGCCWCRWWRSWAWRRCCRRASSARSTRPARRGGHRHRHRAARAAARDLGGGGRALSAIGCGYSHAGFERLAADVRLGAGPGAP